MWVWEIIPITLHFDVLNFNFNFSDHSVSRLISSWSSFLKAEEISFCINFVSSETKNNNAIMSFSQSFLNNYKEHWFEYATLRRNTGNIFPIRQSRVYSNSLHVTKKILIQSKRLPLMPQLCIFKLIHCVAMNRMLLWNPSKRSLHQLKNSTRKFSINSKLY